MRAIIIVVLLTLASAYADVVECENGDRYHGKVLLVDEHTVRLQNDIAGTLSIPRAKVVTISFRARKPAALSTGTNAPAGTPRFDASSIEKVQNELLGGATPEANQMFRDMVSGLMSGKLNVSDVRNKAQNTLKELKDLQKDLGDDDAAALLNSYSAILEGFLKQSSNTQPAPTVPRSALPQAGASKASE